MCSSLRIHLVNSIHFTRFSHTLLILVAGLAATCVRHPMSHPRNAFSKFHPFYTTKPGGRGGEPMHNQPRIILMHNNPLRVISIRIILSWVCMDRGVPANASHVVMVDRISVLTEFLMAVVIRSSPLDIVVCSALFIIMRQRLWSLLDISSRRPAITVIDVCLGGCILGFLFVTLDHLLS